MAPERTKNETAIICLTAGGLQLARRLQRQWAAAEGRPGYEGIPDGEHAPCAVIYAPLRLLVPEGPAVAAADTGSASTAAAELAFDDFAATMEELFRQKSALICIMAAGIVMRSLAPLLVSKHHDPAVLVMDEAGQFAVSLLSGHKGGANRLARKVAEAIGGQAVITTATDVRGARAADSLAAEMDSLAWPESGIKYINRCLAEGQPVSIYSPWPLYPAHFPGYDCRELPAGTGQLSGPAVVLSPWHLAAESQGVLQLFPRNLFAGIGCRKGVSYEDMQQALENALQGAGLKTQCLAGLATIDIKNAEPAILQLAAELGLPVRLFSREELASVMESCEASERVFEKIGVHGVCEPAALLASGMGIRLLGKQVLGPVTISIAMAKSWWWDWGRAAGI